MNKEELKDKIVEVVKHRQGCLIMEVAFYLGSFIEGCTIDLFHQTIDLVVELKSEKRLVTVDFTTPTVTFTNTFLLPGGSEVTISE